MCAWSWAWPQQIRDRHRLHVVHHAEYRLPVTTLQARTGFDPRRADLALWWLQHVRVVHGDAVQPPERISYAALRQVHTEAYLQSLQQPEVLADIFGLPAWDIASDAVLQTVRRACGGTLLAAQIAVEKRVPVVNLLGGFHHAKPAQGAGLCAVNDIAVAASVLRNSGYSGRIGVIDLDAHPPDGTAACMTQLPGATWIGSLSGCDWGPLPGVDETVLPPGTGNLKYLEALDRLLGRMPACDLVFVLAGGDVLTGDPVGGLHLDLPGAWQRDRRVAEHLQGVAAVWLPAGGYTDRAWQVMAGAAWQLVRCRQPPLTARTDPMAMQFARTSRHMKDEALGSWGLDAQDVEEALGLRRPEQHHHLLGFYTEEGLEYGLQSFGVLDTLRRLGYREFAVHISVHEPGERMTLTGLFAEETEPCTLLELVVERKQDAGGPVLYVHWLSLRHPKGSFARDRLRLPGQEVPGLGLAREAGELLARMASRLHVQAVVLRPAWFHIAYVARYRYQFRNPEVQGRFEALIRDLRHMPSLQAPGGNLSLAQASQALAQGQILIQRDGKQPVVYQWESEEMADEVRTDSHTQQAQRESGCIRFQLA